jgi:hypothetical protein
MRLIKMNNEVMNNEVMNDEVMNDEVMNDEVMFYLYEYFVLRRK